LLAFIEFYGKWGTLLVGFGDFPTIKLACLHVSIFNVMNAFVLKGLGGDEM